MEVVPSALDAPVSDGKSGPTVAEPLCDFHSLRGPLWAFFHYRLLYIDVETAKMRISVYGVGDFPLTLFLTWKTTKRHFLKTSEIFLLYVKNVL